MRLDVFLHEKRGIKSRTLAVHLIKEGAVTIDGVVVANPSKQIAPSQEASISVTEGNDSLKYVSRAGQKLAHALNYFNVMEDDVAADVEDDSKFNPKRKVCLDIGSSTGGFSDCLLQRGASFVYAVDVGTDQFDVSLRDNPKVKLFEQTDIRNFADAYEGSEDKKKINFIVGDVSFISLTKIIPVLNDFISSGIVSTTVTSVLLIKPQFEVGKDNLNKSGIVTDLEVIEKAIEAIKNQCIELGWEVGGVIESPIQGGDGNKEYLIGLSKSF